MLTRVINDSGQVNPSGLMQSWAHVFALYKNKGFDFKLQLDPEPGEEQIARWDNGLGGYDGGIQVIRSGVDVYVGIAPGSGLIDYLSYAGTGVPGAVSSQAGAWINPVWDGYLSDMIGQIRTAVVAALGVGGVVQISGFSLGAAMAVLVGRALAVGGMTLPVRCVGHGAPRMLGEGFATLNNVIVSRFVNTTDPVDLLPPQINFVPVGGPLPTLPTPARWANVGIRYKVTQAGVLTQETDPPWPGYAAFSANLLMVTNYHTPASISQAYNEYFLKEGGTGENFAAAAAYFYLVGALITNGPFGKFGAPPIPPPAKPQTAPPLPTVLPPAIQGGGITGFITPFAVDPLTAPGGAFVPPGIGFDPH